MLEQAVAELLAVHLPSRERGRGGFDTNRIGACQVLGKREALLSLSERRRKIRALAGASSFG
jgi:hypothetical protein